MTRPAKTQWDFGELFPREPSKKVLSVSELTWQIRQLLENKVGQVWVAGELTNLRFQSSGHVYFTLKDATAQLACVLFRGEIQVDRTLLAEGRRVLLQGEVTVYEPRGQYQLRVTAAESQGVGALQAAFERLKQRLKALGWFAPERKRPLPIYPFRLGLVTSPSGAAIRDVLHVIERRHPALEVILAPCRVQGDGAAAEIAEAIRLLNEYSRTMATSASTEANALDLILVTRGGGSLEDLWAFNEEAVARAIFESGLPVISAVGHEIDFTISDFVADLRAATPSAAAEILTEGVFSSRQFLQHAAERMRCLLGLQMETKERRLDQAAQRLARLHPRRQFSDWMQRVDELLASVWRCVRQGARHQHARWEHLSTRLGRVRPAIMLVARQERLKGLERTLLEQGRARLRQHRARLDTVAARLRLLGPEQVLARGYSITTEAETGKVVRDARLVPPGTQIKTRVQHGQVVSRVEGAPR